MTAPRPADPAGESLASLLAQARAEERAAIAAELRRQAASLLPGRLTPRRALEEAARRLEGKG